MTDRSTARTRRNSPSALGRNAYGSEAPATSLARYALAADRGFRTADLDTLLATGPTFPDPETFAQGGNQMTPETVGPLSRLVDVGRVPPRGQEVQVVATAEECAALAKDFGLPAIQSLLRRSTSSKPRPKASM